MIQFVFIALFVMTVLAGIFSYFKPAHKSESFVKYMEDQSGYSEGESSIHKRTRELNLIVSKGILQIHKQMDNVVLAQNKLLDSIQDQQQILNNTGKDAQNVMLLAKQEGAAGDKDILQLEDLTSQIQDQQHLSVANGQDLILLNNQLTQSRQAFADEMEMAQMNTQISLSMLQDHVDALSNQASDIFDKVNQRNQEIRDQMDQMQTKMQGMTENASFLDDEQGQKIKDAIKLTMGHVHISMRRLADNEERNKELMEDLKQRQEEAKELLNDKIQRFKDEQQRQEDSKELLNEKVQDSQDKIDEERQKQEDQQATTQQRISDQMQRMQDQQNH